MTMHKSLMGRGFDRYQFLKEPIVKEMAPERTRTAQETRSAPSQGLGSLTEEERSYLKDLLNYGAYLGSDVAKKVLDKLFRK